MVDKFFLRIIFNFNLRLKLYNSLFNYIILNLIFNKEINLLVTKSNRITILPITNKNKLISLNNYFDKVLISKNQISIQLNKDKTFQHRANKQ